MPVETMHMLLLPKPEDESNSSDIENFCTYFIFTFKGVVAGLLCVLGIAGMLTDFDFDE